MTKREQAPDLVETARVKWEAVGVLVKRYRGGLLEEPPLHAGLMRFVLAAQMGAATQKVKAIRL